MNLSRWFAVASFAAVSLAGCESSVVPVPAAFTGTLEGKAWSGDVVAYAIRTPSSGDTLYVWVSNPPGAQGVANEQLRLRVVVNGPGTYPLRDNDAALWEAVGGDVITGTYVTQSSAPGTLVLESYGADGTTVKGRVEFTAVGSGKRGTVATMRNGVFESVLQRFPLPD